jgi:hypothetical protein
MLLWRHARDVLPVNSALRRRNFFEYGLRRRRESREQSWPGNSRQATCKRWHRLKEVSPRQLLHPAPQSLSVSVSCHGFHDITATFLRGIPQPKGIF